jgi:mono/diheme cytochrome c family protein
LLPVLLFIAFWVLLGLAVFFVAGSGPGGRRAGARGPSYRGTRAMGFALFIVYVLFGIALPLIFLSGNHANANSQIGGNALTPAEKRGREIFAFRCGFCHTLAGANAVGKVGPNLDDIKPGYSLVFHTIEYGCLQNPPAGSQQSCLGAGTMPAGIIQGQQAEDVAKFVAAVAGKE